MPPAAFGAVHEEVEARWRMPAARRIASTARSWPIKRSSGSSSSVVVKPSAAGSQRRRSASGESAVGCSGMMARLWHGCGDGERGACSRARFLFYGGFVAAPDLMSASLGQTVFVSNTRAAGMVVAGGLLAIGVELWPSLRFLSAGWCPLTSVLNRPMMRSARSAARSTTGGSSPSAGSNLFPAHCQRLASIRFPARSSISIPRCRPPCLDIAQLPSFTPRSAEVSRTRRGRPCRATGSPR
jgi:hypothetical protein